MGRARRLAMGRASDGEGETLSDGEGEEGETLSDGRCLAMGARGVSLSSPGPDPPDTKTAELLHLFCDCILSGPNQDTQTFRQQQPPSQPTGDPYVFAMRAQRPSPSNTFQSPAALPSSVTLPRAHPVPAHSCRRTLAGPLQACAT